MNIIEETVGTYRVEITGMTIHQIKDVFEDKWGAMVWSGGAAYPSGDIKLQFKKALAALDAAQPAQVNAMLVEALERMVESVTGVDQVSAVNEARAALTAAKQAQPERAPLSDEEIEQAVKTHGVSWTGYREDKHGFYTIPILSPYHYQFARAIEAAHGIGTEK